MGKIFQRAGYRTGYFGKTHFGRPDESVAQGDEGWQDSFLWHQQYNDYLTSNNIATRFPEHKEIRHPEMRYWDIGRSNIPYEHYYEKVITDHAIEFIGQNRNQPFLCYVGHLAPHGPFTPPAPYDKLYDPDKLTLTEYPDNCLDNKPELFKRWVTQNRKYNNERELRIFLAHAYGLISLVDDQVGRIVDTLEKLQLQEQTLVIFTTDHGDFFTDYGIIGKSWSMDERLIKTTLLAAGPDIKPGVKSEAITDNVDILPTMLDFCGLECPRQLQGRSWLPVAQGKTATHKESAFAYNLFHDHLYEAKRMAIIKKRWKWVECSDFKGELYDLEQDPAERVNLVDQSDKQELINACRLELLRWNLIYSGQGLDHQDRMRNWEYQTNFYDESKFPTPRPLNNPF